MKEKLYKIFEGEVKSFNDQTLTIEHFISTEEEDRSLDIMRADGMKMDGVPVVLKQHGFDPDTGNEPIAKPVSITVGTNSKGIKGIVVKTQYFDGSKLTPPDNTGQRLYLKAKENFMPYWSIGFRGDNAVPKTNGGTEYKTWWLFEYSQVGVPDNIGAAIIKQMSSDELVKQSNTFFTVGIEKEKEKSNPDDGGTWKFCICKACGHSEKHTAGNPCGKCPECGEQMQGSNTKLLILEDTIIYDDALEVICQAKDINKEEAEKLLAPKCIYNLKSIAERVASELPWEAMRTIWFGMLDELETIDGTEKLVKMVIKELAELITPHAIAFSQNTGNRNEGIAIKESIKNKTYIDKKEDTSDSAQVSDVKEVKPPIVLRLKNKPEKQKVRLPFSIKDLSENFRAVFKSSLKEEINKVRGKV